MHDVFDSFFPALRRMLMLPATLRGESRSWRGRLVVLVAWPLFCIVQLLHWLGFLLDDVFFRGWRNVRVREPLFVLGPPRSGTTHLHHVLSNDERTTTFRMWECLFGLSVTGRRILAGLARLDGAIGRPFGRLGGWLGQRLLADMDDVHPFAMDAPEEDFLALMPAVQCFILVIAFPHAGWLWRTARLDEESSKRERDRLMRFYHACVQKHLHVHGPDRRFLSKNASFSGMAEALLETFPDARIMACTRDPKQTVPSQLSSIEPGLRAAGFDGVPESLRDRFVDLLRFYYEHLERVAEVHAERVVIVDNVALRDRLERTVKEAYRALDLDVGERFATALADADDRSRGFRSGHSYSLAQYGLSEPVIEAAFASVYDRRRFGKSAAEDSRGGEPE